MMWALRIQPFLTSTSELTSICYDEQVELRLKKIRKNLTLEVERLVRKPTKSKQDKVYAWIVAAGMEKERYLWNITEEEKTNFDNYMWMENEANT